jgi:U32 family peptidase
MELVSLEGAYMKIIIMPKNKEELIKASSYIDAYMLGIKGLSTNMPSDFTLEEVIDIIKNINKEVFISLNKNMHNVDIEELKRVMISLDLYQVNIVYYDIAVVNIKKELNLKNDLVWNQEHLTNNYITSNYWYEHGAKYTILSSEITKEEIIEIKDNALAKIIVPIFGYLPMFVSKRNVVKNYLETFNIKDDSNIYYLEHNGEEYPMIDNVDGSIAYSSKILNGISEVPNLNVDYILLNSFLVDSDLFIEITKMFNEVNNDNKEEYAKIIDSKLNTDTGFLYKETFYKVKR